MSEVTVVEQTELERYQARVSRDHRYNLRIIQWHTDLHEATGFELPHTPTTNSLYINEYLLDEDGYKDYEKLDEDAIVKKFAQVIQFARSKGYPVEKKYDDDYFRVSVVIFDSNDGASGDRTVQMNYHANRSAICKKNVVGKKVIAGHYEPEREVEIVEWECDKLSFLNVEV